VRKEFLPFQLPFRGKQLKNNLPAADNLKEIISASSAPLR
jgi:hypothetical protein